jgi:hypothetical protein
MQAGKLMGGLAHGKEAQAMQHTEAIKIMNYFQTQQNCNQMMRQMLQHIYFQLQT